MSELTNAELNLAIVKLASENLKLKAKVKKLNKTFRHYYFSYGKDNACDKCGLDLRDEIHKIG